MFVGGTLFLSADDGGEEGAEGEPAHSASMRHSMVRATLHLHEPSWSFSIKQALSA